MIRQEHTSEIIIHVDNLNHNISVIKERIGDTRKIMAVVKDNAYGHGMFGVAKHICDHVDWFCVSAIEEGVLLREQGITNPILVFEVPRSGQASTYAMHDLTAVVSDLLTIDELSPGTNYHVLFDTGMHRLGLSKGDIQDIKEQIERRADVHCTGIFTHYANSDIKDDSRVRDQYVLFKEIRSHFSDDLYTHTANTGAIFNYPEKYWFDGVRPGIGLYGYGPDENSVVDGLLPSMEWNSYISQVRGIKKGSYVSYGNEWQAPSDGFIATVPVGYSDGIDRKMKNKIHFMHNGMVFPQVGNITMDYIMLFSPTSDFTKGGKVKLLDLNEHNFRYWCKLSETILYEPMVSIPRGISRVYK